MFGGLISFIGGTAFRWILGEVFGFLRARDEHKAEMARMQMQMQMEQQRAQLQRDSIQQAHTLGLQIIEAQSAAAAEAMAGQTLLAAVQGANEAGKRSDWIGAFNALIRPQLAQVAIIMLVLQAFFPGVVTLTPVMVDLFCAVLGVFVGERIRAKSTT